MLVLVFVAGLDVDDEPDEPDEPESPDPFESLGPFEDPVDGLDLLVSLFPDESDFADFKPPARTIPNSIGHHKEWVKACKTGSPTTCNFDYSGALTEAVLLGNVAYRTGKKLYWDPAKLVATNCPEADQLLRREYRKGWTL